MLIGYARISTQDQSLDLQEDALLNAGCEETHQDIASGVKCARQGLEEALKRLRRGDTLVVWRLDRLGRSLRHLLELISDLETRGIGFRSLQESIDTTTPGGRLVFHVFGALAEFERELLRERTIAGLRAAADRGRMGGRPRLMDSEKIRLARTLHQNKSITIGEICRTLGVSKGTLYRNLAV